MKGFVPRRIAFLLLLPAVTAFGAETSRPLETTLFALTAPTECSKAKIDPLSAARAEIEAFRKEKKTKTALEKTVNDWLNEERNSGKDVASLNWIRALDPWLLPKNFPARPAFVRCAAELTSYSDARAAKKPDLTAASEALTDWTNCLAIIYPEAKPAEFDAIVKCLSGLQAANHPGLKN